MIRIHLKRLIADYEFERARKLTLDEISAATGIHRTTLSKIIGRPGHSTTTRHLSQLCSFFQCSLADLAEYIPDDEKEVAGENEESERK